MLSIFLLILLVCFSRQDKIKIMLLNHHELVVEVVGEMDDEVGEVADEDEVVAEEVVIEVVGEMDDEDEVIPHPNDLGDEMRSQKGDCLLVRVNSR